MTDIADRNLIRATSKSVFETIKNRRVTRKFSDKPVAKAHVLRILEAARWAPSGGMRRLNSYVIVQNTKNLYKIRAASPGILSYPQVIIVMCIDKSKAHAFEFDDLNQGSIYVDLGTAAENMLLTAEELKIGACPVMSFHKGAIQLILDLPATLEPAMMIILGYSATKKTRKQSFIKLPPFDEITHWEHYRGKAI